MRRVLSLVPLPVMGFGFYDHHMAVQRHFVGWDKPLLPAVSAWLVDPFGRGEAADLSDWTLAVPSQRAGQRLLECLIARAGDGGVRLVPPRIMTAEPLANHLLKGAAPIVPQPIRRLAWLEALGDGRELKALIPMPPPISDVAAWSRIAQQLERVHVELSSALKGWADVVDAGQRIETFTESERWETIGRVIDRYLHVVGEMGFVDPQQARLEAVRTGEHGMVGRLGLVGLSDMHASLKGLLGHLKDRCVSFVFAPESEADRFDDYGSILPEAWQGSIPLDASQVRIANRPEDQAYEALLAASDHKSSESRLVVMDDRVRPAMEQLIRLEGFQPGLDMHRLGQSRPMRLLEVVGQYLTTRHAAAMAALIRHPDIERALQAMLGASWADWIGPLDAYMSTHLPHQMVAEQVGEHADDGVEAMFEALEELLQPLVGPVRSLRAWIEPMRKFLDGIYGDWMVDRQDPASQRLIEAIDRMVDGWRHIYQGPFEGPIVEAPQAIQWWASALGDEPIPCEPSADEIEILGWLDVLADDVARPILIGCNEDVFPASAGSDAYLPESLRSSMGLVDRDRRYARDAYALRAVVASRPQTLLFAGKQSHEGDPLMLSRLLLADTPQVMAQRIEDFVGPVGTASKGPTFGLAEDDILGDPNRWPPRPVPRAIDRLSVTAFADYLRCPYRFYLSHMLELVSLDDEATELDAASFGSLVHAVLSDFAGSSASAQGDPDKIYDRLREFLDQRFERRYGNQPMPALRIQKEQLLGRLKAFAQWQGGWAAQGWQIVAHERLLEAPLPMGHGRFTVYGKIDRIDRHRDTGQMVLFDYKTGESFRTPKQRHQRGDQWIDLQLPLYQHLALSNGYEPIQDMGYIVIPSNLDKVGESMAQWSEADLGQAMEAAIAVVRSIRDGQFELNDTYSSPFDPFDALCGVQQLRHLLDVEPSS